MKKILYPNRLLIRFIIFLVMIFLSGCVSGESANCRLPCQLEISQTEPISVQNLLNTLLEHGWIQENPNRSLQATYARDTFSNVLETTVSIELDGTRPHFYGSEIILYIGHIGSVILNPENILSQRIESIQVDTYISISTTWLFYGMPQGGRILPFYLPEDISETNPCSDRSHYIAYYDEGNTIIRAVVAHPILSNLWTTPVEIVYPIDEELEFSSLWIGQFDRMDHTPCMSD